MKRKRKASPAQLRARAAFAAKYGGKKGKRRKARNPKRPAKRFMRHCTRRVRGRVRSPGAVCASQWKRMKGKARRRWERKGNSEIRRMTGKRRPKTTRRNSLPLGTAVHLKVRDPRYRDGRPLPGVWKIVGRQGGQLVTRHPSGTVIRVSPQYAVRANPPIHAITYEERKATDAGPELYEHKFEGKRPRLEWDGRNLRIKRGQSRYSVRQDGRGDSWIHG